MKKNPRKHFIRDNITFVERDDLSIFLGYEFESVFIEVNDRKSSLVVGTK